MTAGRNNLCRCGDLGYIQCQAHDGNNGKQGGEGNDAKAGHAVAPFTCSGGNTDTEA